MSVVYGYVLVTHGHRQVDARHRGAVRQLSNLRDFAATKSCDLRWRFDYSRSVRGAHSLPILFELLDQCLASGIKLVMDDSSRLFRACPDYDTRAALLGELEPFRGHLFGLRQGRRLSELSESQMFLLSSGDMKADFKLPYSHKRRRSVEDGTKQTSSANTASASSRRAMSRRKAAELSEVRAELREAGHSTTGAAIADLANERGLTTTRGGPWRADTVSRLLKRLDEETAKGGSRQAG